MSSHISWEIKGELLATKSPRLIKKMLNCNLKRTSNLFFIVAIFLCINFAPLKAHELSPSILDITVSPKTVQLKIRFSVEAMLAGLNLSEENDTNLSENAAKYDELRNLKPEQIKGRFYDRWPILMKDIMLNQSGREVTLDFQELSVPEVGNIELTRISHLYLEGELENSEPIVFSWSSKFGPIVVRQLGVENGLTQFLSNGDVSDPIFNFGSSDDGKFATFFDYIGVGFDHIIPKGWDHIVFVLGLFFFSSKLKPLIWQISAFTFAHTVTLALGSLGYIRIVPEIVEPLIALSILYISIENIFIKKFTTWRPIVIFAFGMLHGLGFASVLGEFGLPAGFFVPALIGFNVGVELGQLSVVLIAFISLGYWLNKKSFYEKTVALPISAIIGLIGAFWFIERVI